jgi:hypothetical protein
MHKTTTHNLINTRRALHTPLRALAPLLLALTIGTAVAATLEPAAPSPAVAQTATSQPPSTELDALLAKLARPTPAETPFVELRGSALLKQPQRLQGRLQQPDADTLVREVMTPFHERTTIRAENVLIERYDNDSNTPRTRKFSLRRAPELEGLLSSFTSLLRGDRALLEKNYTVQMDDGASWKLQLTPRDPRLLKRVSEIILRGRGNALECMQLNQPDGQRTLTLLGMAAVAAAKVGDANALGALCEGKPAVSAP